MDRGREVIWATVRNNSDLPIHDVVLYVFENGFKKPVNVVPRIEAKGSELVSLHRNKIYQVGSHTNCTIEGAGYEQVHFQDTRSGETRARSSGL